jgi:hypothetical protein
MRTFDMFDTLVGRWYFYPASIFKQVEAMDNPGFYNYRLYCEHQGGSFDEIYNNYQKVSGVSDAKRDELKAMEYKLELEQTFPIMENVRQLQPDSIIISDTYFSEDQLKDILSWCGVHPYGQVMAGTDLKRSGRVWDMVKSDMHLDDSDHVYEIATSKGVPVTRYVNGAFTESESRIQSAGFHNLACLCRMLRLINPYEGAFAEIWHDQTQTNIPLLLLLTNYLHSMAVKKKYTRLLFTERDCVNLYKLFVTRFPNIDSRRFMTSRETYQTASEDFQGYVKAIYQPGSLIIDGHGTSKSCVMFFEKYLGFKPDRFFVVFDDREDYPAPDHIGTWNDGIYHHIEKMNYTRLGRLKDVQKGAAVREDPLVSEYIDPQIAAVRAARKFLEQGFVIEDIEPAPEIMKYLLRSINQHLSIDKYVDHRNM